MNYTESEKTLDLKQLLFFILKRWKKILLFLIIGALLGCGLAVVRGKPSPADMDTSSLNMERIIQYAHYQELYQQQLESEKTSVLLQMNPNEVYSAYSKFYVTMPSQQAELVRQKYSALLSDVDFLKELIEVSGLNCDERAIKELVSIYMSIVDPVTLWEQSGLAPATGKLTVSVTTPTKESGDALLKLLNEKTALLNAELAQRFSSFSVELLTETYQFGYVEVVSDTQGTAAELLQDYADVLLDLEKQMSDDELTYCSAVYLSNGASAPQKEMLSLIKHFVKYAFVFGALFALMAAGVFFLQFLLDDHIKTAHEVHEYGLYTIACLQSSQNKKSWIDKLFSDDKLPSNSKEYLLNAMKALATGKLVLAGDQNDPVTAETMKWLASNMDQLCVMDRLARDERGLLAAKEADGAILVIHLWKSTAFDLKRELYVMRQIGKSVKGVVVLRG